MADFRMDRSRRRTALLARYYTGLEQLGHTGFVAMLDDQELLAATMSIEAALSKAVFLDDEEEEGDR
jgi:hypothetical protein